MNKQEAIETIKNIDTLNINDMIAGQQVDMVIKNQVLDIIDQIEPQKPVIPKFVVDWIEHARAEGYSLYGALETAREGTEVFDWLFGNHKTNQDIFAQAWIFGYEVEQEQLYTVEIPNPALDNLEFVIVLKRLRGRVCLVNTYDYMGRELSDEYKLTEAEIKENFEWAWDAGFAKEVED